MRILLSLLLLLIPSLLLSSFFALASPLSSAKDVSVSSAAEAHQAPFDVKVIDGKRRTEFGDNRGYRIYIPQPRDGKSFAPYPILVIMHGFLMSSSQQDNNSRFLAQHGIAVLAPNLTRILVGHAVRDSNMDDVVDHICWLTKETSDRKSKYYHLFDFNRMAIGGNSSGGAACLEVILRAQHQNIPVKAMCLLDGDPWKRSRDLIASIKPMKVLCLRADPALCNEWASVLKFLKPLTFPIDDVRIVGAHHCDAENPTTKRCMCVCGISHSKYRDLFQKVLTAYLVDVLDAPGESQTGRFKETVMRLEHEGKVAVRLNILLSNELADDKAQSDK